jgi:hypothetical protein
MNTFVVPKLVILRLVSVLVIAAAADARAEQWTMRLSIAGREVEGTPLAWSADSVVLLERDGRLCDFSTADAKNFSRVSSDFRSYSQSELRGRLLREFGSQFDVSGTGHYLVVHPAGQRDQWAERFEDLHRSFVHYFTARGMRPTEPQFPLIAVVFHGREDFQRYAAAEGARIPAGTLGYYSPVTNRILLYDQTAGQRGGANWQDNAVTIIHEATHQTAFNTGLHSRYTMPPRWVAEGLGLMFEAPGVWNSRQYTRQADRINRDFLRAFQRHAATRRRNGSLAEFVSSDRLFQEDIDAAYAEAWALTFFLVETEPRKYAQYLSKTAARPQFTAYRSPERLRDFTEVFGSNLVMLEARMLRFIEGLK